MSKKEKRKKQFAVSPRVVVFGKSWIVLVIAKLARREPRPPDALISIEALNDRFSPEGEDGRRPDEGGNGMSRPLFAFIRPW